MYVYDIWQALFYSSVIGVWLELLAEWTNILGTTWYALISSIISTGLFLLFYLNGQEKKENIKRAVIIVSGVILVFNLALTLLTSSI